jgi:hypothetical protein
MLNITGLYRSMLYWIYIHSIVDIHKLTQYPLPPPHQMLEGVWLGRVLYCKPCCKLTTEQGLQWQIENCAGDYDKQTRENCELSEFKDNV